MRRIVLLIFILCINLIGFAQSVNLEITNYEESTIYTNQSQVKIKLSTVTSIDGELYSIENYQYQVMPLASNGTLGDPVYLSSFNTSPLSEITIKRYVHDYGRLCFYCLVSYKDKQNGEIWSCEDGVNKTIIYDDQVPTIPQNLVVEEVGRSSIKLSWDASTDNESLKGYKIVAGNSSTLTTTNSGTISSGIEPCTNYNVKVYAVDKAGNYSDYISKWVKTTSDVPLTQIFDRDYSHVCRIGLPASKSVILLPGFGYTPASDNCNCHIYIESGECPSEKSLNEMNSEMDLIYVGEKDDYQVNDLEESQVVFKEEEQQGTSGQINNKLSNSEIKSNVIYPNPTNGILYISSKTNVNNLKIYNLQGELIFSKNNSKEVNVSFLESGLYLISIEQKDGKILVERFMKK